MWKTSQNVLKTQKQYIYFIIRVARPISFSDLSLHRIEINYEQMTILWSYYEYNMNICFTSKFAPGIPSVLALIRSVFWSALPSLFPRDLIFFCCVKPKTYLNREINCSEINCNKLVGIQSTTLIIGLSICKSWDSVETCINKYCSKAETLLRRTDTFDTVCFLYTSLARISKAKTVKRTLLQTDFFSLQIKSSPALHLHE